MPASPPYPTAIRAKARSVTNLDDTFTDDNERPPLLPTSLGRDSEERQEAASIPIILYVDQILPKTRDRLVTIGADEPLTKAAEFLFEPRCRMLVVCNAKGAMIGVVTRTDIIREIQHCQGCACTRWCSSVMTSNVISCRADDRIDHIWTTMKERGLHSIPVIDSERKPIGLLSARDALEARLASVEYEEGLLRDYVMCVGYR